jgi:hypothetical protein
MNTNTQMSMSFASAWGGDRPTQMMDVSTTTEFKVEVKNTWSKEMRLNGLVLHLKPLLQRESITLNMFNDQDELVCIPQADRNSYGEPKVAGTTNLTSPGFLRTNDLHMERDIVIPAGGTYLFKVTLTDPDGKDVKAEMWNEYLAYSARMSEIPVDMSDFVIKELASLRKDL